MKLYIVTGMSGAGKSLIVKTLEDMGFYCIDNIPPSLIPKFAQIINESRTSDNVAVVVDIRGGELLSDIFPALCELGELNIQYEIIFLEANDKVLLKRYKETRRKHPLEVDGNIAKAIEKERKTLESIKKKSDYIIDSSDLLPKQLREELTALLSKGSEYETLMVNVISFGYKYGTPLECDIIFDVRFIPNPYYNSSMRKLTGKNETVKEYVLRQEQTVVFLEKTTELLEFLLPNYIREGKTQLVIGIGCTGGRHRSVAIGDKLGSMLMANNHRAIINHRDINKDSRG
ncbi:MAG: RNase adapter RapZ [Clostridia bacterium]